MGNAGSRKETVRRKLPVGKLFARDQLVSRTPQRAANAGDGGHENIDLTSFDSLHVPQTDFHEFRESFLGESPFIALTTYVSAKNLLLFEEFAAVRHSKLG